MWVIRKLFNKFKRFTPELYGYDRDGTPLYCSHIWISEQVDGFTIHKCSECGTYENIR